MAFVRVSRDKRGYEHIYLIQPPPARGKPSRPRVLYWFRTPPGVKVGREPFDDAVKRALEAQNPGVTFDWNALLTMTTAPPDVEHWRERRRVERAAKRARFAAQAQTRNSDAAAPDDDEVEEGEAEVALDEGDEPPLSTAGPSVAAIDDERPAATAGPEVNAEGRRRPRRRGGRRRKRPARSGGAVTDGTSQPAGADGSHASLENVEKVEPAPSSTPADGSKEE